MGALGMAGVLLVGTLSGCQAWNSWLDLFRFKGDDTSRQKLEGPGEPVANGKVATSLPARMIVYKLTLPVGTFSTNDKVWAQLNEDALDSKTNVLLAQNGLRVATGPIARWETLRKLIDVPGASTDQMVCETDGHSLLNVITRSNVSDQIVVSVDRDLQQRGRTFEKCDNGFQLTMRQVRKMANGKPAGPAELMVQLQPVVTQGQGSGAPQSGMAGTNLGSGGVMTSFTSEEGFSDLAMGTTLGEGQFLLVSPEDPKGNLFNVGSLWLSDMERVPATATVLVFVPVLGEVNK